MDNIIIIAVVALGGLGLIAAIVLYFIASKFKVFEDPKIDEVEEALPAANCGGCGYPGCRPPPLQSPRDRHCDRHEPPRP